MTKILGLQGVSSLVGCRKFCDLEAGNAISSILGTKLSAIDKTDFLQITCS